MKFVMPIVWISICQAVLCLFFLSQNSRNKMTYWAKKAVVFPTTLALKEDLDYVLTMICTILAEIICPFPGKYGLRKWVEVNKWGSEFQCCMYILFKWLQWESLKLLSRKGILWQKVKTSSKQLLISSQRHCSLVWNTASVLSRPCAKLRNGFWS